MELELMFAHTSLSVTYIIVVTHTLVFCLICTPSSLGPEALRNSAVHIRQNTRSHVTTIKFTCRWNIL